MFKNRNDLNYTEKIVLLVLFSLLWEKGKTSPKPKNWHGSVQMDLCKVWKWLNQCSYKNGWINVIIIIFLRRCEFIPFMSPQEVLAKIQKHNQPQPWICSALDRLQVYRFTIFIDNHDPWCTKYLLLWLDTIRYDQIALDR